jgi:hypothetical protein
MTWQLHPARKHFPAFAAAAIDGALILRPLGLGRWSLFLPSQTQAGAVMLKDAGLDAPTPAAHRQPSCQHHGSRHHRLFRWLCRHADIATVVRRRRENYQRWSAATQKKTCLIASDYRLHLLHLPCHQSLDDRELDWMIAAIQKLGATIN